MNMIRAQNRCEVDSDVAKSGVTGSMDNVRTPVTLLKSTKFGANTEVSFPFTTLMLVQNFKEYLRVSAPTVCVVFSLFSTDYHSKEASSV